MKIMEAAIQNEWKTDVFDPIATPYLKMESQPLSAPLILHHGIQNQLFEIWLSHIQNGYQPLYKSRPLNCTDFSAEEILLKNVLEKPKNSHPNEKNVLLQFCALVQKHCQEAVQRRRLHGVEGTYIATKENIGKLIFLADQDISTTAALIDIQNFSGSLAKISAAFDVALQKRLQKIHQKIVSHHRVPLQEKALVANRGRVAVIADMLLTSTGRLNLGLVDVMKRSFFNEHKLLMHHEQDLCHTLDVLKASSSMQNKLHAVVKPFSPFFSSNTLIRLSLDLSPEIPVSNRHAQLTVLETLLSDWRQGSLGSCFNKSIAMMAMGPLKEKMLDDLISLVVHGKLIRKKEGEQKNFIPILDLDDPALESEILIERSGKLSSAAGFIWEAPGILQGCRQIGLDEASVKRAMQAWITCVSEEKELSPHESFKVDPKTFLKQLIKIHGNTSSLKRDLKYRTFLAFSNETCPPFLKAWESCYSAMADSPSSRVVREKILRCITSAIGPHWPKSFKEDPDIQVAKKLFNKVLNNALSLRYDPGVCWDLNTKAFVLQEMKQGKSSLTFKAVNTPEKFKKFVIHQLQTTKRILAKANEKGLEKQLKALDKLFTFISKKDTVASSFIKQAIRVYDPKNKAVSDPLKTWRRLSHLPFKDAVDESNNTLSLYKKITSAQTSIVRPNNGKELLKAYLAFWLKSQDTEQKLNSIEMDQYTFTLEKTKIQENPESIQTWIDQHVIQPGEWIALQPVTENIRRKCEQLICDHILESPLINKFKQAMQKNPETTFFSYGQTLIRVLLNISKQPSLSLKTQLSQKLTDLMLNDVLTEEESSTFMNSALCIAKIQSHEKKKELSLICFYNPLEKQIQLALWDESEKCYSCLREEEWIFYIPWENYELQIME